LISLHLLKQLLYTLLNVILGESTQALANTTTALGSSLILLLPICAEFLLQRPYSQASKPPLTPLSSRY